MSLFHRLASVLCLLALSTCGTGSDTSGVPEVDITALPPCALPGDAPPPDTKRRLRGCKSAEFVKLENLSMSNAVWTDPYTVYVVGDIYQAEDFTSNYFLHRLTQDPEKSWTQTLDGDQWGVPKSVSAGPDGGIRICGFKSEWVDDDLISHAWLAHFHPSGQLIRQNSFKDAEHETRCRTITALPNGNVLMAGVESERPEADDAYKYRTSWTALADAEGNLIGKTSLGIKEEIILSVASEKHALLVAYSATESGGLAWDLIHLNSRGEEQARWKPDNPRLENTIAPVPVALPSGDFFLIYSEAADIKDKFLIHFSRYKADGTRLWDEIVNPNIQWFPVETKIASNGDIVVLEAFLSPQTQDADTADASDHAAAAEPVFKMRVSRLDKDGASLWSEPFVTITAKGSVLTAHMTETSVSLLANETLYTAYISD